MLVSKPRGVQGPLCMKSAAAELIGTFGMVFAGTGAIMIDEISGGKVTHLGIGITFGLVVAAMIYAFGSVSGAHINPAVTLAFAFTRRLRWRVAAYYIPAQLAGGVLASVVLYQLFGPAANMGATIPAGSVEQSLVLEAILAFFLMAVIMALSLEPRAAGPVAALAIGGTVGLEAIFAGPISGASMNPARSFGPAVVAWEWHGHWAYWAGPIDRRVVGRRLRVLAEGGEGPLRGQGGRREPSEEATEGRDSSSIEEGRRPAHQAERGSPAD